MKHQEGQPQRRSAERRVYTLCSFDRGLVVPTVQLIDAETDDEAVALARGSEQCSLREVWDRHRLVAVIEPSSRSPAYHF